MRSTDEFERDDGGHCSELKMNITRPITDRVPPVRAIGQVIHVGRRMATAEARLVGPDGRLCANASTTCFLFDAA